MARRGKPRKNSAHTASGRPSRAGQTRSDTGSSYLAIKRLALLDAAAAYKALQSLCISSDLERHARGRPYTHAEAAAQQERSDIVHATTTAASRTVNLSHPLGVAYERGIIDRGEYEAGEEYARLHRNVWRGVPQDIEAQVSSGDFKDLTSTGTIKPPAPPVSLFRNLVAGDPGFVPGISDPAEAQKRRLRLAERLGKASQALKRVRVPIPGLADFGIASLMTLDAHSSSMPSDFACLRLVEDVVIHGAAPAFLQPGGARTAAAQHEQEVFKAGLAALAAEFGFDKMDQRKRAPAIAHSTAPPETASKAPVEPAKPAPRIARNKGLDVVFSPETDMDRPSDESIAVAMAKLLRRTTAKTDE